MNSDITDQLRQRACPAGKPWTGDNPEEDHGHTDCWLFHQAADEIERLRALITEWADAGDRWIARGIEPGRSLEDLHRMIRDSAIATAALRAEVGR